LLAAFGALLGRYAAQEEVLVGCPVAGRERRELEPLIGFFVNPLPMRVNLLGNPRFAELVARVRRMVLDAYAHQALPFELVVEAVRPARDLARHPIFQVMMIFQGAAPAAPTAPGLTVEPLEFAEGPARSDLDLYLWQSTDGLRGYFLFNTALFEDATISRLARRWLALLQGVTLEPALALAGLRFDGAAALPSLPSLANRRPVAPVVAPTP
ncbi:MAG: hypothetical protein FJ399_17395, partial [Verrucomicrobia bacterium]|nr:hypothetical protein [Verrucomicrobiota bacterium]